MTEMQQNKNKAEQPENPTEKSANQFGINTENREIRFGFVGNPI